MSITISHFPGRDQEEKRAREVGGGGEGGRFMNTSICKYSNTAFLPTNQLMNKFEVLDEKTMDLVIGLTPLFKKYATMSMPDVPDMFPKGNVLISQVRDMTSSPRATYLSHRYAT